MSENQEHSPEHKDIESAKLRLINPAATGKQWMIGFESDNPEICFALNQAIRSELTSLHLNPFHQVGVTSNGENEPGYHAWEIWKEADPKELEILLSAIKQRASKFIN